MVRRYADLGFEQIRMLPRHEPGVSLLPVELRDAVHSTGAPPASVPIVLGSDLGMPAFAIYRELELAVRAGLTPMEAIQAATIVQARAMRLDHESGTPTLGRRADIILVDGDPLRDISDIRNVRWVIAAGKLYETATLWNAAGFGTP